MGGQVCFLAASGRRGELLSSSESFRKAGVKGRPETTLSRVARNRF